MPRRPKPPTEFDPQPDDLPPEEFNAERLGVDPTTDLRPGDPLPQRDPDKESEEDRTAPGDGKRRIPVEINLTEVELDKLAAEFATEIEYQYDQQSSSRSDIQRWLTIYRARPPFGTKTYPMAHASNVTVGIAANHADQVIARLMQAIFNPEPHWVVTELNRRFADNVKPYERYLDWNRRNAWNQWEMVFDFVQDVVKLGTGVGYNDWQVQSLYRYDDRAKRTIFVGDRVGPAPRWVPREDFLIPIGFRDIQQAPWVAHRPWFSWDMLERMAHQGVIENLESLRGHADDEPDVKEARRRNRDQVQSTSPDGDDRFGLWSPWYVWFRRDLDDDGWPEEYVMLLHLGERKILRLVSNPSPVGTRPYFASQFIRQAGEFDGAGIPERLEQLQDEESTIHNQRRDRAHLANIVMWITDAAGGSTLPETIRPESGKIIKVLGGPEKLKEIHPATNVPIDIQEEDYVRRMAAEFIGQSDIDMSRLSSPAGRAAATTIMALMQEGARRFDLNASQIRAALTEQGHQLTELWQVYGLPGPDVAGSPEQVLDEDDAVKVRELLEQPVSLRGLIAVQLNIATAAVNKEVEKQSNMQLMQMIGAYGDKMTQQYAPLFLNPSVPKEMKDLLLHLVKAQDKALSKVLQAHNSFDLEIALAGEIFEQWMQTGATMQPPQPQGQSGGQPGQPQLPAPSAGGGGPKPAGGNPVMALLGGQAGAKRR